MSEEVESDWTPHPWALHVKKLIDRDLDWECVSIDYVQNGYIFYVRTRTERFFLSLDEEKVTHRFTCPAWCRDRQGLSPAEARDEILRYAKKELKYAVSCAIKK